MSWDAWLVTVDGDGLGSWNYTHNTNGMIAQAIEAMGAGATAQASGPLGPAIGPSWWERLHGMSGPDGAAFLARIVAALQADPDTYRAMDPPNGWGSYDTLVPVLQDMADAVPADTTTMWEAWG